MYLCVLCGLAFALHKPQRTRRYTKEERHGIARFARRSHRQPNQRGLGRPGSEWFPALKLNPRIFLCPAKETEVCAGEPSMTFVIFPNQLAQYTMRSSSAESPICPPIRTGTDFRKLGR